MHKFPRICGTVHLASRSERRSVKRIFGQNIGCTDDDTFNKRRVPMIEP